MKWGLPHLRLAGLALPLLTGGCMSGVLPGTDASDPSCVLLCALTRDLSGEPAANPAAVAAAVPNTKAKTPRPARHQAAQRRLPRAATVVAASPAKPRKIVARVHLRPVRPPVPAEVSVIPQAPARMESPTPVAIAPAPSVAALQPQAAPLQSLSHSIPGSAGIMVPNWQAQ